MDGHPCPWWLIGTFDNPLRRWVQPADKILAGLVRPGQTALDIGPGMGYFTLPLARLVGPNGLVIAADVQAQMLAGLRRRAAREGVLDCIRLHPAQPDRLGLSTPIDFALAFWMLHEVRDPGRLLAEVFTVLRPGGCLLLVEPLVHVPKARWQREVRQAQAAGFTLQTVRNVSLSRALIFQKTE